MHPSVVHELPAGLAADIIAAEVLGIKGRVVVEMVDERGHVVDRQEADNYVNLAAWQAYAKAVQRQVWHYGNQGTAGTRTYDNQSVILTPTFRNDHIACWADTTAEDSTDKFAFGEVTAWAHRWGQGSPSTRQGLVQPSLCSITDTTVVWVWEWTTTNGNGSFQSVGWRRIYPAAATGNPVLFDASLPNPRTVATASFSDAAGSNGLTNTMGTNGLSFTQAGNWWDTGTGSFWSVVPDSGVMKLKSNPATIDGNGNITLTGATVDQSAVAAFAAGLKGNSANPALFQTYALCRLGASGDWIGVGFSGATTARRPFIARVTNAGVTTYTNVNAGTYAVESGFLDVTYDGTNLWVCAMNGNTGAPAIHRIDPATGTISATITAFGTVPTNFPQLGVGATLYAAHSIEWDVTNGWYWVRVGSSAGEYIVNMDSSGTWLGVCMFPGQWTSPTMTGTQAGTVTSRGWAAWDPIVMGHGFIAPATSGGNPEQVLGSSPTANSTVYIGHLLAMGSIVYTRVQGPASNTATRTTYGAITGPFPNFASRSLLGALATKNSTQTMRITYTLTFT